MHVLLPSYRCFWHLKKKYLAKFEIKPLIKKILSEIEKIKTMFNIYTRQSHVHITMYSLYLITNVAFECLHTTESTTGLLVHFL